MSGTEIIEESLNKLINYIESQNYRGYDPYDALKSPLIKLPVLRSNKLIRFGFQQLVKRSPLNLRPLLRIHKGYNPVTLGLCIQGYSYLAEANRIRNTDYRIPIIYDECIKRIEFLIAELKNLIPPGYHGACWGYDFPWEARHATIPAHKPTVVATGIITNALYAAYKITGNRDCAELIISSAQFVLNDLKRTLSVDNYIFSYSPFDRQQVINASMKGVWILSQAYDLTSNEALKTEARTAAQFVVSQQQSDGPWYYSLDPKGNWTDNYHSGYVLDCLDTYSRLCNDKDFNENLNRGYQFYKDHFIEKGGMPRFFAGKAYPVDCTAAAQTILTLTRFGDKELAIRVAGWMIKNMQSGNGSFFFRKQKHYIIRTSFMRWSDAWMFAALGYLLVSSVKSD